MSATIRRGAVMAVLLTLCTTALAHESEPSPAEPSGTAPPATTAGGSDLFSALGELRDALRWERAGYTIEAGGRFAWDLTRFGHANDKSDGGDFTAVNPVLRGGKDRFSWRIEGDALGVDSRTNLFEAWAQYDVDPAITVRAGRIRVPLGSEFATREEDLPLPGYSFASYLAGRWATGAQADGSVLDDRLWYQATASFGSGFGLEGERRQSNRYVLRAAVHPLEGLLAEDSPYRVHADGIWLSGSVAYDDDFDDPLIVATPLGNTTFRTAKLDGDSGSWWHWETGYAHGPFRAMIERTEGTADDVPYTGGEDDFDQLTSWSARATWNLSGGRPMWKDGALVTERAEGGGDDWELSARYSNADIDRDLFDRGLTTFGVSTQEVRTFTGAVNWRPDDVLRVTLAYVQTISDDDLGTFGGTNRDHAVVLRIEIAF